MVRSILMTTLALVGTSLPAACAPATSPDGGAAAGSAASVAPAIDDRAARAFFEVADALVRDREPGSGQWRDLMTSRAVAFLESEGLPRETLAEAYSIALRPSRSDERDLIDRATPLGQIVTHVEGAVARREELLSFLDTLDARALGIDVDRLERVVPAAWRTTRPTIALAVFGPDLREGDLFVVDLALAKDTDLGPYLGHETFQWYRRQHRLVDPEKVDAVDADLMWALDRLQARGIANQIDKAPLVDGSLAAPEAQRARIDLFRQAISQSPEHLRLLDRLLASIAADPGRRAEIGAEIRKLLPQGGHPTGFYMATVILESGAGDELTATAGDPFAFVELYQRAASSPGGAAPALSPEAMAVIRQLATKYTPSGASTSLPAMHG